MIIYIYAGVQQQIEDINQDFMAAFARRDYDAIKEIYHEDCRLMAPAFPVQFGRESKISWVTSCSYNVFSGFLNLLTPDQLTKHSPALLFHHHFFGIIHYLTLEIT